MALNRSPFAFEIDANSKCSLTVRRGEKCTSYQHKRRSILGTKNCVTEFVLLPYLYHLLLLPLQNNHVREQKTPMRPTFSGDDSFIKIITYLYRLHISDCDGFSGIKWFCVYVRKARLHSSFFSVRKI